MPWNNHTGWLGVKHQVIYLLICWICAESTPPPPRHLSNWHLFVTKHKDMPVTGRYHCRVTHGECWCASSLWPTQAPYHWFVSASHRCTSAAWPCAPSCRKAWTHTRRRTSLCSGTAGPRPWPDASNTWMSRYRNWSTNLVNSLALFCLSCFSLPCPAVLFLSFLVLLCCVLFCCAFSCLPLSCLVTSFLALSCLILSCFTLSCLSPSLAWSCLALSHPQTLRGFRPQNTFTASTHPCLVLKSALFSDSTQGLLPQTSNGLYSDAFYFDADPLIREREEMSNDFIFYFLFHAQQWRG